jgi:uncharacterized protein
MTDEDEVKIGVTVTLGGMLKEVEKNEPAEYHEAMVEKAGHLIHKNMKELSEFSEGVTRAKVLHARIDKTMIRAKERKPQFKGVPCKAGCSACCHTNVDITSDEGVLLLERISGGVAIDMDRLKMQARVENTTEAWGKLSFDERRCVFLDENKSCKVYEDRPMVCRKWFIIGDPKRCEDYNASGPIFVDFNTEAIASAGFSLDGIYDRKESGRLPSVLHRLLSK